MIFENIRISLNIELKNKLNTKAFRLVRLINGDYFCRHGIFSTVTDTILPRNNQQIAFWLFYFSLFNIFDSSELIKTRNVCIAVIISVSLCGDLTIRKVNSFNMFYTFSFILNQYFRFGGPRMFNT